MINKEYKTISQNRRALAPKLKKLASRCNLTIKTFLDQNFSELTFFYRALSHSPLSTPQFQTYATVIIPSRTRLLSPTINTILFP